MFKIEDGREHFYQWDIDRKLIVEDNTINEVHFCNRTGDCSLICETYKDDGLNIVKVPDILLQNSWRIHVYAFDSNYTKHEEIFEVKQRSKPADYIYTEEELKTWEELKQQVENKVDKIEGMGLSSLDFNQTLKYKYDTTASNVKNCVKYDDTPTADKAGAVKVATGTHGLYISPDGILKTQPASKNEILAKGSQHRPIVPLHLDYAVRCATVQKGVGGVLTSEKRYLPPSCERLEEELKALRDRIAALEAKI